MWGNGRIFISHSHADNDACEPLLAALDAWGVDYWFDRQQLDAGAQLTDRLQVAIGERDMFLRICTAATRASFWMTLEFNAFRGLQLSEQQRQGKRTNRRVSVNLILDVSYKSAADALNERADATVDATGSPPAVWLAQLGAALGIAPSKSARKGVSRRAAIGLGAAAVVTAAAAGTAVVVKEQSTTVATASAPRPKKVPFAVPNPQTLDPRMAWSFRCGDKIAPTIALGASAVFVNSDDGLFALAPIDGSVVWTNAKVNGNEAHAPVVAGDTVYAFGGLGTLAAFGVSDGIVRWSVDTGESFDLAGIAVDAGSVFLAAGDGSVKAFSTSEGSKSWQSAVLAKPDLNSPNPVVDGGLVLTGAADGYFYALSAATGAQVWRYQTGGEITATAATDGATVYFGSKDSAVYAVDIATGALKWRRALDSQVTVAPTVASGVVYTGVGGNLHALSADSGATVWALPVGSVDASGTVDSFDSVSAGAAVSGDAIYVPSGTYLYAFSAHAAATYSPTSGAQPYAWRFNAATSFDNTVAPIVGAGVVYFSSDDGRIYALKTA